MTGENLKNNNRGMSLVIMLMLIAVFSVFIIGTYTILDRHVSNTVDSEANNGAYYTGEGVLRITSTEIDKFAFEISNEANLNEEVLTRAEFTTRLNATIASQTEEYFKDKIAAGSFEEYNIESVTVVPSSVESDEYTCLFDITTIISNDRNTRKKITGTYGVLYLTESSQSTTTSMMVINESTPMLTAIEDITAQNSVSLNGNAKLRGEFSYPGHYNAAADAEHFYNNDNTFVVDTSSLVRGDVKIPEIPDPPYEGDPSTLRNQYPIGPPYLGDGWTHWYSDQRNRQVINIPFTGLVWNTGRNEQRKDFYVNGYMYVQNRSLTINVNTDNAFIKCQNLEIDNELIINAYADNFKFMVDSNLVAKDEGKLKVNTNGHDVYMLCNNLYPDPHIGDINVETTGSGTLFIYFYSTIQQNNEANININVKNEGTVNIVIINQFWVNDGGYGNITFNAQNPAGQDHAGDLNFFVVGHQFGIWQSGSMTFNASEGTKLNVIADNLVMRGDLKMLGDATVNVYARQSCEFNGDPYTNGYPRLRALSNFQFGDEDLSENDKAQKIINPKLNVYYYGTNTLIVRNYMCCANFFSAGAADIDIRNCLFYGNIFSAAPGPEGNARRFELDFKNSYLSCGAIYAPRMNVVVDGDRASSNIYDTDEGQFVTCIFACVTGYNIDFTGNAMAKSSNVATEHMVLEVEMEFMPGVVAIGEDYSGSHFFRGFKVE